MSDSLSWRDLLGQLISSPSERERIANEVGVRPITLSRWVTGESTPRPHNLQQLLQALPKQQQDEFLESLEQAFPDLIPAERPHSPEEIPFAFINEVLNTRAHIADHLRFWTISRQVLQHALRQLDPEPTGMAITVVRCMPPTHDGKIHSLHESVGLGTPPWEGDLEPRAVFLGAESLAAYVTRSCHFEQIPDLKTEQTFVPAYRAEHEVSAAACPIMYAGRVAGCLLLSSTQPRYFLSQTRRLLIESYTRLVALAFDPEEFYPVSMLAFQLIPLPDEQAPHLATFRQRVMEIMRRSTNRPEPLTSIEAEQMAWQELEDILLHMPLRTESILG